MTKLIFTCRNFVIVPEIWGHESHLSAFSCCFSSLLLCCLPEVQRNPWEPVVHSCFLQVKSCLNLVLGATVLEKSCLKRMLNTVSILLSVRYKFDDDICYGTLYYLCLLQHRGWVSVKPPAHKPLPLYQWFIFNIGFSARNHDQKSVCAGWSRLQIIMMPVLYLNIKSVLCVVSNILLYVATGHIIVHTL